MAPFTGNIKVYQMWIWKLWHALRTSMTICSLWRTETIRSYKSRVSRPLCSRTWFWSPWSIPWHGRWLHLQAEQLHPDKKRLATTRPPRAVQDRDYIDYIYKLSDSFHLKSHQKKNRRWVYIVHNRIFSPPFMKVWPRRFCALLTKSHLEKMGKAGWIWIWDSSGMFPTLDGQKI